jgi:hypothetical protein
MEKRRLKLEEEEREVQEMAWMGMEDRDVES